MKRWLLYLIFSVSFISIMLLIKAPACWFSSDFFDCRSARERRTGTKPGYFKFSGNRTLKFLFYTSEHVIDIKENRYIFHTCTVPKSWDLTKDTKRDIFDSRLKHLVQCSAGFDVVIFHVKDLPGPKLLKKAQTLKVPDHQLWAYYNKESPLNTINLIHCKFDGVFNLVITPKRESDVQAAYGYYRKKEGNLNQLSLDPIVRPKTRMVAWIASHCNEERDTLVASLMRYFPIDVFGYCGRKFNQNQICVKYSRSCHTLLKNYKFILAFENSFCKDYVTEKYWNTLSRGNIPIVYGGSNYDKTLVVPGSFINVQDFKSVVDLADHILEVNKTYSNYLKYQEWRMTFEIDYKPNDRHRFEIIGEKLYKLLVNKGVKLKTYQLSSFYGKKENCFYHQSVKKL